MVLENVLISFFSSFPSTSFWKDCLFCICVTCSCLPCHVLIDRKFWALYSGPLICVSVFYASFILFWLQQLCTIVWSQEAWYLPLCFSFSRLLRLAIQSILCFHTKFKIFSISEELDPKTRTHPLDQRLWPWTWCFKGPLSKFSRTIPLLRQLSVPEACSLWGSRECCCKLMKVVI